MRYFILFFLLIFAKGVCGQDIYSKPKSHPYDSSGTTNTIIYVGQKPAYGNSGATQTLRGTPIDTLFAWLLRFGFDTASVGTLDTLKNGYGIKTLSFNGSANQTVIVDSALLSAYYLRVKDSSLYYPYASNPRGYGTGSGSVTSVATGYGLSGGTITTTGTLRADTARKSGLPTYFYVDSCQTKNAASYWSLTGNAGTTPSTNFIGTTDNTGFRIKTNDTLVAVFHDTVAGITTDATAIGNIGIFNGTQTGMTLGLNNIKDTNDFAIACRAIGQNSNNVFELAAITSPTHFGGQFCIFGMNGANEYYFGLGLPSNTTGYKTMFELSDSARGIVAQANRGLTYNNDSAGSHYTFPLKDGTADQFMKTNGAGVLSFTSTLNVATQAAKDSSTKAASTAYVDRAVWNHLPAIVSSNLIVTTDTSNLIIYTDTSSLSFSVYRVDVSATISSITPGGAVELHVQYVLGGAPVDFLLLSSNIAPTAVMGAAGIYLFNPLTIAIDKGTSIRIGSKTNSSYSGLLWAEAASLEYLYSK